MSLKEPRAGLPSSFDVEAWPSHADVVRATVGSANQVDTHVFIGGGLAAADPVFLRRAEITHVVLMCDNGERRVPGVRHLVLAAEDHPSYDIRPDALAALEFIQDSLNAGERVLVACQAGISRSATVVLLHLMLGGYPLDLAMGRLRGVRSFVKPNAGFMRFLRATDARLTRLRVGSERPWESPPPVLGYEAADGGCAGSQWSHGR